MRPSTLGFLKIVAMGVILVGAQRVASATGGVCSMRIARDTQTGVIHLMSACNVGADCYTDSSGATHKCKKQASTSGGAAQGGYTCWCPWTAANDPCVKRFKPSPVDPTVGTAADCVNNNCVPPVCPPEWEPEGDPEAEYLSCPCP
ncbi:MAG: hypothetical protein JNM10_05520 [Planctomycetia bacterium]|nr:hypothetical protein [Planctomycetia bacterium]